MGLGTVEKSHQWVQQRVHTWVVPVVVLISLQISWLRKTPGSISKATKVKIALEFVPSGQQDHKRIKLNWPPNVFGESKHP